MTGPWTDIRVLLVSSSYPFSRTDFRALFVHHMAVALADAGGRVRVLTPATGASGVPRAERWQGVDIVRFAYPGVASARFRLTGGDGMWQRLKNRPARTSVVPGLLASMVGAIRSAIAEFEPDVCIAHWMVPTAACCALAMAGQGRSGPKLLAMGHGSDVHLLGRLPGGGALLRGLAARGVVTATSDTLARRISQIGRLGKVPTTPLVVPPPLSERTQGWRPDGELRLGCLGRVMADKGLERALDVVERLPDATLKIAGDGSGAQALVAALRHRGVRASLVGSVVGPAKSRFLNELDALLFLPDPRPATAFGDNLPVSVLEALGHGLPVLTTRVGALPALLDKGGGWVVDADPDAIADTLRELSEPVAERLSTQAREVAAPYLPDASLARLWQVLSRT